MIDKTCVYLNLLELYRKFGIKEDKIWDAVSGTYTFLERNNYFEDN